MASDSGVIWPVIEPGDFPAMDESVWVECFPVMIQSGVWEAFLTLRVTSAANLSLLINRRLVHAVVHLSYLVFGKSPYTIPKSENSLQTCCHVVTPVKHLEIFICSSGPRCGSE